MIGYLKKIFSKVLTLVLSAIIISNILEYVWEFLQFCEPLYLYKELLDYINLIYFILEIKKPSFAKFDFIVFSHLAAFKIPKTMILIDNIDITR